MPYSPSSAADDSVWITELIVTFSDATSDRFLINRTKSGSVLPPDLGEQAAEWTKLDFHKCDCCPLSAATEICPAAESLDFTIMKFRGKNPEERVTATAIDSQQRYTVVDSDLADVCTTFVELAVFFSGCPIGRGFKSMMANLRPFATAPELSRHIIGHFLIKNRGKLKDSQKEIRERLDPLRSVFHHLSKRLADNADTDLDTVQDSIHQLDAFAAMISESLREVYNEFKGEMEWDAGNAGIKKDKDIAINIATGRPLTNEERLQTDDSWIIQRLKRMLNVDDK